MFRALSTIRGLILVFGLVALGLPAALIEQLGTVRALNEVNEVLAQVREGELASADVLQLQIDEQTAIRGYAASREPLFLESYNRDRVAMPGRLQDLRRSLQAAGVPHSAIEQVRRLEDDNAAWLHNVAEVTIRTRRYEGTNGRGPSLVGRFRADLVPIDDALTLRYHEAVDLRDSAIERTSRATIIAVGVIAVEIVIFAVVIVRMRRALDRERAVVEALQRVASGRLLAPRHLRIGSAYRSATRGTRIGGDVYDVFRLDDDRTLLVVADVSGKGVTAAVDTTFVRYAIRAIASDVADPAEVVRRFDKLFLASGAAPEAFISLFLGIHDRRDETIAYANAGHEACWIRRTDRLDQLFPTGPVIGVGGVPFGAGATRLARGELLILATDGLTEARDRSGGFVPADRVRSWILEPETTHPQRYVDAVVSAVTTYARGRISDDLAVLAVTPA